MDETYPRIEGEGLHTVIDQIRAAVVDRWGPAPRGLVKVLIYSKGHSASPEVRAQRQVRPEEAVFEGGGDVNIVFLQQQLAMSQQMVMQLHGKLLESHTQTQLVATGAHQQITARTVGTAAGDLGGPWQLVTSVFLLMAYPMARRILQVPDGVSMGALMKQSMGALQLALSVGDADGPPAEVYAEIVETAKLPKAANVVAALKARPKETVSALLKLFSEIAQAVQTDPELAESLKAVPGAGMLLGKVG